MEKLTEINIGELIADDKNFNKGTEKGKQLINNSLSKFGAGRSILIDKNNKIIAGNKTIENAAEIGLDNIIVVETDGSKIVAVKRNDIDLNTAQGRELALADNATSKANIEWDKEVLDTVSEEFGIDIEDWEVEEGIGNEETIEMTDENILATQSDYLVCANIRVLVTKEEIDIFRKAHEKYVEKNSLNIGFVNEIFKDYANG